MIITFKDNIVFTKGAKKSTICDYNSKKIYHLTSDETVFVEKILGINENAISSISERENIEELLKIGIITFGDTVNKGCMHFNYTHTVDFAWIEVTPQCNLKCKHCYDESHSGRLEAMSFKDFEYVANELIKYGVKSVQVIGGEPLILGNNLKEMLTYAKSIFESVEVFTNGTLITEEWANYFSENKIKIALSVYSYNSQIHDEVTQRKGSHQLTTKAIELLSKKNIQFRTANVLMKGVRLCKKNTDLYELNSNKDVVRMCGRGNLSLLTRELIKKRLITKKSFSLPLNYKLFERISHGHNCFGRRLYIATNLDVYPCVMERRISHGSLRNNSLKNILNSNIFEMTKDHINVCKDCEFRYCCHDCRPDSLSNDVYAKPWYCTYNPYSGEWIDVEEYIDFLEAKYDIKFE